MNGRRARELRRATGHHPAMPVEYLGNIPPVYRQFELAGPWVKVRKGVPAELNPDFGTRARYQLAKRRGLVQVRPA